MIRPRRPDPVLVIDEADLSRFRSWLAGRGYADSTRIEWSRRVREAYARGAASPDEVNARFGNLRAMTRTGFRQALHAFAAFREAGG